MVGVCRRMPSLRFPKVEWRAADVAVSSLEPLFRGADAVVHLAWLIQPGRDREQTRRVNVAGSERVFQAVARAGVQALVYASSVGTYAPGPKDRRVDETWPVTGVETSFYSRDKAAVEALLDRFEARAPGRAGGAAAAGPDLLARRGIRDPAAVRRTAAAGCAPSPALRPVRPTRRSPGVPGASRQGRGARLSAGADGRSPRSLQPRRGARDRDRPAASALPGPVGAAARTRASSGCRG